MYDELYTAWKLEHENAELEKLSSEFYFRAAEYMRRLREESRMLDKRTLKTSLLEKEMRNAKRMVHELIQTRYRKIIRKVAKGEEIPVDNFTLEEKTVYPGLSPFAEMVQGFAKEIIRGRTPKVKTEAETKRVALRFLKDVPAIIGADMKTYGPYKTEDVSALPIGNAKILKKQGLVETIDTA
jgi:DNA replication initiation complex subunit (GINS family)